MHILILNWRDADHPLSGGAEIVTMEHAKGWVAKGHQVTWFTSWYPHSKHEEILSGVRMIRRAGSLTVYPSAMWYVLFQSHTFDVIVDEVHGFPFFSPLVTRKPVVVFIHEIAGIIWDFMYPFPVNVIGKFVESWYFLLYKRCLFWTDAASTIDELTAHGIPRNQCTAIPCPITIDKKFLVPGSWFPEKGSKQLINKNQELRTKNKEPTYIFVSRVVKMKGIEEVIKAFSFIIQGQKDAKLWIVGGGESSYIRLLKAMLRDYNVEKSVRFWGKVSEHKKLELMAKAHILLHGSVKEGWGLVVLEAARMGTPAVVYDVGGLRDVVEHGKTGIIIRDNSPQTMAKGALSLYKNNRLYRSLQKEGIRWVKSLTWPDVIKKSELLLKKAYTADAKNHYEP